MKKIAVFTDFSGQSVNAARYAMHLAKKLGAGVTLLEVYLSPASMKRALQAVINGGDSWDTESEEPDGLITMGLWLTNDFGQHNFPGTPVPPINYNENREIADVMSSIMNSDEVILIVVAPPEGQDVATFALSGSCQKIIDWAGVPVLIVPANTAIKNPEKVAFAPSLDDCDTAYINSLLNIVGNFTPDVMVSCINNEGDDRQDREKQLMNTFHEASDYGKLYYRRVTDERAVHQWNWLRDNKKCDMLTIVQQPPQSLRDFFKLANTPIAAYHLTIPLMVLPAIG